MPPNEGLEDGNDDHLLQHSGIIGDLPEHLFILWTRSSKYFTPERVQFNSFLDGLPGNGRDPLQAKSKPLEAFLDDGKPADLPDEEAEAVKTLLRRLLHYDPRKRPTPSQVLQNPWFAS